MPTILIQVYAKTKKGNNLLGLFVKYVPFLPTYRLMSVATQWVHSFAVLISMSPKIDPKKIIQLFLAKTFFNNLC